VNIQPTRAVPRVPGLPQQADCFQPAKDLLHSLAGLLAHQIAACRVVRIDRTPTGSRCFAPGVASPAAGEGPRRSPPCHSLCRRPGDAPGAADARHHCSGRRALGDSSGRRQLTIDGEAMPVFHQHVLPIVSLASWPWPLRNSCASRSVVEACVALLRRSPWKSPWDCPDRRAASAERPSA
jgi:hypothetical protein